MKYNMENFPEVPVCRTEKDRENLVVRMITWRFGFKKELEESLAYHDKMIDHWEHKVTEKHPLYPYREQIAGEWRTARGILTAVLGVEPKIEEETKR